MKEIIKNNPLNIFILLICAGILVAGILLYSLQPTMSWRSDVIIGVLMAVSIWAALNVPLRTSSNRRTNHNYHKYHN